MVDNYILKSIEIGLQKCAETSLWCAQCIERTKGDQQGSEQDLL